MKRPRRSAILARAAASPAVAGDKSRPAPATCPLSTRTRRRTLRLAHAAATGRCRSAPGEPELTEARGRRAGRAHPPPRGRDGPRQPPRRVHARAPRRPDGHVHPQVDYEYDFVGGAVGERRALDSAFVVHYDEPVEGQRDWRQRNVTRRRRGRVGVRDRLRPAARLEEVEAGDATARRGAGERGVLTMALSVSEAPARSPGTARAADLVGRRRQGGHRQVAAHRLRRLAAGADGPAGRPRRRRPRRREPAHLPRPADVRSARSRDFIQRRVDPRSRTWSSETGAPGLRPDQRRRGPALGREHQARAEGAGHEPRPRPWTWTSC